MFPQPLMATLHAHRSIQFPHSDTDECSKFETVYSALFECLLLFLELPRPHFSFGREIPLAPAGHALWLLSHPVSEDQNNLARPAGLYLYTPFRYLADNRVLISAHYQGVCRLNRL